MNRDPKKNRKAFTAEDFSFFIDHESNRPEAKSAAAYMRLLKEDSLPPWALFAFTDFKGVDPTPAGDHLPALVGDKFLLLAPAEIDDGFEGLMLAEHAVSGRQIRASYQGKDYLIQVPEFDDYTAARAGTQIDIVEELMPLPDDARSH